MDRSTQIDPIQKRRLPFVRRRSGRAGTGRLAGDGGPESSANRPRRSFVHPGQEGVAAVEFALCLPLLAIVCFGVVDLARVYTLENQLKNAAREGANYAQTDPLSQQPSGTTCTDPNTIQYHAYSEAGTTNVTVAVTPAESGGCQTCATANPAILPGSQITVSVGKQFVPITPLLSTFIGTPTIHGRVTVTVQGSGTCS
jgi:Flp pilus assembly protein TadG